MTFGTINQSEPRAASSNGTPIRVLIVDDHPIVAYGLERLVADAPGMAVLGHASDHRSALSMAKQLEPDVMVVDISLGGSGPNGLALMKDLRDALPRVKILALSMHDEELFAERAIHSGASGYLMKAAAASQITEAIRTVSAGNMYRSTWMKDREIGREAGGPAAADSANPQHSVLRKLSDREFEVFEFIGRGRGTREIAEQLGVSVKTIETHRMRIKTKLGIATTPDLVRTAVHWVSAVESKA